MLLKEIVLRDPFILRNDSDHTYYLYGTTPAYDGTGFYCYSSKDLKEYDGPFKVFAPSKDFWGTKNYWAPEVYLINNKYYLLATFKADNHTRGCQLFVSDSPKGPFVEYSDILTPNDFEALDATLCFDDDNKPYIVFCREWLQTQIGEMWRQNLSLDLKHAIGQPIYLFKGDDACWASTNVHFCSRKICVTDGPFLYKNSKHKVLLWSTFIDYKNYGIGYAKFDDANNVCIQSAKALPIIDGGHSMIFKTFEGTDLLVFHKDNSQSGHESVAMISVKINEQGDLIINE